MANKQVYMDHASTTPVDSGVLEAMKPYLTENFGNPSSLYYKIGLDAGKAVDQARATVARIIGAGKEEIVFTGSGTESVNLAIQGIALKKDAGHIITTKIEHPAIIETCKYLEKKGFTVTYLGVDKQGLVNPQDVEKSIQTDTILIAIGHANVEIGTEQDIVSIGKIAREHKISLFVDASSSMGWIPVNVQNLNCDLLAFTAHKFYGPKGAGALYVRKGTLLEPLIRGGGQEAGLKSGVENVPAIVGLAKALELAVQDLEKESKRLSGLRDKLIKNVLERIDNSWLNGHPTNRLPNNANFGFKYIEGESIVMALDMQGISASTGSACSSRTLEASPVLLALGQDPEDTHGSLRFSLGRENTVEDVDYVLEELPKVIEGLREMSPYGKEIK